MKDHHLGDIGDQRKYYQHLCDEIKEGVQEWQEECAIYNGDYDEF